MAYWWVPMAISAAGSLYKGITDSNRYAEQSELDQEYALANSISIREAGKTNADALAFTGQINASMILASGKIENAASQIIADYNSGKSILIQEYNASMIEEEALLVLEQADIDLAQLKRQQDRELGRVQVAHGASGAIMGQDTPGAVVADAEFQMETERFIVRRGADVQFKKLMDKAAVSRFSGYEEALSIQLTSKLQQGVTSANSALRALGTVTQSTIDSKTTMYNANIDADRVFQGGMLSSYNNSAASNQSLWGGVFNAGTTLAGYYYQNKATQENNEYLASLLK